MSNYYFQYDTTTGVIYPYLQDSAPASSSTMGVLGPYPVDTASATVVMAYTYPNRFLAQNGALVEQPYFTVAVAQAGNSYTLTATLNNSPAMAPTDATFTILGQTYTETLTNGQATMTLDVHASVANQQVQISVGATGCVSGTTMIGSNPPSTTLQAYTPNGSVPTIAPTSMKYLETYYASTLDPQTLFADIGTAVGLLMHTMHHVVLPALQQATYSPVTLDANQTNAHADIVANVLPKIYTTLENAYPNGGGKSVQYNRYVIDQAVSDASFASYMQDMATIPNLT